MNGKAKVCVMYGDGINCDNETLEAFRMAGAEPEKALIADIAEGAIDLENFHILAFPGGFSASDYLGAGKFFAIKMRSLVGDKVMKFVEDEKLIIGICNGFQILSKYPLLPSPFEAQTISVTYNESARFEDRWVHLKMNEESPCVFTKGLGIMYLPCRHGEGRVDVLNRGVLDSLNESNQVVARYSMVDGKSAQGKYPINPNGSRDDIAGICDSSGRIFGWMPHPEAFLYFTNHPRWTIEKERMKRAGETKPMIGEGLGIFENAVKYVKDNF
jgi:phosphoribosylformylglycinamidine synthase